MINFRFHLVSLIAVFLALGLGILVGSTVVDQKIVNRLDSEIKSVRKENKARRATNDQLTKENSQLKQFIEETAPFAGDARLDGLSIAVVAERGVDGGVVKQTEQALQAAGADVPAVMWMDAPWQLDSDAHVQSLQSAAQLTSTGSTLRNAALGLLAHRFAKAPTKASTSTSRPTLSRPRSAVSSTVPTTTTTLPSAARVDVLAALERAGFLSVADGSASAFDAFPAHPVNVLVITGDDSTFAGSDLTSAFVRALAADNLPTVVAAAYDAGSDQEAAPERGASLASILDDQALSRAASTVDDLELEQGRIATVLAFAAGTVGHYGYGTGASGPLPPHPA